MLAKRLFFKKDLSMIISRKSNTQAEISLELVEKST
jgi:hypothetical protein